MQFQRLKQQQMIKQVQGQGVLGNGKGGFRQFPLNQSHQQMTENRARNGTLNLPNSAWPTLQQSQQQQPNSGSAMRAVFLGNPGPKRECAGTGVFLPRRVGTQTETRKKPGIYLFLSFFLNFTLFMLWGFIYSVIPILFLIYLMYLFRLSSYLARQSGPGSEFELRSHGCGFKTPTPSSNQKSQ